ncbi:MAG: helix-hairpin-helix domain-containing protein [Gammaproteobacteria bacterium]|nr:helix-hairpin-helix domain-containing protein [Gammaproteobacteria bacterium]
MKRMFCFIAMIVSITLGAPTTLFAQPVEKPAEVSDVLNKVDINTADAATLALALDGIGMAKAQEIVAYRELNGEFKSIEELAEVKGIGEATIAKNRDRIIIAVKK